MGKYLKKILFLFLNVLIFHVRSDVAFLPAEKQLDDDTYTAYSVDSYDDSYFDDYQLEADNGTLSSQKVNDYKEDYPDEYEYDSYDDEDAADKMPKDYCFLMLNDMAIPLSRYTSQSILTATVHVFLGDDLAFECHLPDNLLTGKIEWLLNDTLVDLKDYSFNLVIDRRMLDTFHNRLVVKSKFRLSHMIYIVQFPLIVLGNYQNKSRIYLRLTKVFNCFIFILIDSYVFQPNMSSREFNLYRFGRVFFIMGTCLGLTVLCTLLLVAASYSLKKSAFTVII